MPANEYMSKGAVTALLKYRPQREALAEAAREAHNRYGEELKQGNTLSQLGVSTARKGASEIKGIYGTAANESARTHALLAPVLEHLQTTNPYRLAAGNEAAANSERLSGERANAEKDAVVKRSAAEALPAFSATMAKQGLLKALQSIKAKEEGVNFSEGAERVNQAGKLEEAATKNRLTERGQNITRTNAKEGHELSKWEHEHPASKGGPVGSGTTGAGVKELTTKEQNEGKATIDQIRHYAGELGAGSTSRAELVQILSEGKPLSHHTRYKIIKGPEGKEKQVPESIPIPAIPSFKPDPLMSAALDAAENNGQITAHTAHLLEQQGYNVRGLGFKVLSPPKPASRQQNQAANKVGQRTGRRVGKALSNIKL